jgi:hypothetical protein
MAKAWKKTGADPVIAAQPVDRVRLPGPADAVVPRRPIDLLRLRRPCQTHGEHHHDRQNAALSDYIGHCPTSGLKSVDATVKPARTAKLRCGPEPRGSGPAVGRYYFPRAKGA